MSARKPLRFYCPICRSLQKVHRGICNECGKLIGCSIINYDEADTYYGCQDNHMLVEQLQEVTRSRDALITKLYSILIYKTTYGSPRDELIQESLRDVKQTARNALREFGIDEETPPSPTMSLSE